MKVLLNVTRSISGNSIRTDMLGCTPTKMIMLLQQILGWGLQDSGWRTSSHRLVSLYGSYIASRNVTFDTPILEAHTPHNSKF
eukprot:2367743-Amphidinium_carterae.1